MKTRLIIVIACAGALFTAGLGLGATGVTVVKLRAALGAKAEVPAPKAAGRASGLFTSRLSGKTLVWRLTFSHLTGAALSAHVHLGKVGVAGPVAVPLCGPCVSGAHGTVTVTAKVAGALLKGGAYVNVHTKRNAAGEIRGQVGGGATAAPAPAATSTTTSDGGYGGYG